MSPVKQVLQHKHVKPEAPSSSASEHPAWFVAYKQQVDRQFSDQDEINKQQGKDIKQQADEIVRLSRTVRAYEDIELRKLKEIGRLKILNVLKMQQMPHHWNIFVGKLSQQQLSVLKKNGIGHQAVRATSYDRYQKQGNEAAHSPTAKAAANAVAALPTADKNMFVELFDVVFGDGVYDSIWQGWTVQV